MQTDAYEQMDNMRCLVREYRVLAFEGPVRILICSHDYVSSNWKRVDRGNMCDAEYLRKKGSLNADTYERKNPLQL